MGVGLYSKCKSKEEISFHHDKIFCIQNIFNLKKEGKSVGICLKKINTLHLISFFKHLSLSLTSQRRNVLFNPFLEYCQSGLKEETTPLGRYESETNSTYR